MPLAWKPHFENCIKVIPFDSIACPLCVPKSLEYTSEWGSVIQNCSNSHPDISRGYTCLDNDTWVRKEVELGRVLDWEKPDFFICWPQGRYSQVLSGVLWKVGVWALPTTIHVSSLMGLDLYHQQNKCVIKSSNPFWPHIHLISPTPSQPNARKSWPACLHCLSSLSFSASFPSAQSPDAPHG